jgi:hypothetical protein
MMRLHKSGRTQCAPTVIGAALLLAVACGEGKPTLPEPQKAATAERTASSSPPELPAMPPDPDHMGTVPMEIATTAGSSTFTTKGLGECTYTDDAAIYDVPAAMWHATLRAEGQSVSYVNVTVWQFKNRSANQIAVGVQLGPNFRHISTVKGSALVGEGTGKGEKSGELATIEVNGKDDKNTMLALQVRCAKVTKPVEEGGR